MLLVGRQEVYLACEKYDSMMAACSLPVRNSVIVTGAGLEKIMMEQGWKNHDF